jgi:hypothetical protein
MTLEQELKDLGIIVSKSFKPNAEEAAIMESLIKKVNEKLVRTETIVQDIHCKPIDPGFLQPIKHI